MDDERDLTRTFKWEVYKNCRSAFDRAVSEAVLISLSVNNREENTLNSREEWGSYDLPELTLKERLHRKEALNRDPDSKELKGTALSTNEGGLWEGGRGRRTRDPTSSSWGLRDSKRRRLMEGISKLGPNKLGLMELGLKGSPSNNAPEVGVPLVQAINYEAPVLNGVSDNRVKKIVFGSNDIRYKISQMHNDGRTDQIPIIPVSNWSETSRMVTGVSMSTSPSTVDNCNSRNVVNKYDNIPVVTGYVETIGIRTTRPSTPTILMRSTSPSGARSSMSVSMTGDQDKSHKVSKTNLKLRFVDSEIDPNVISSKFPLPKFNSYKVLNTNNSELRVKTPKTILPQTKPKSKAKVLGKPAKLSHAKPSNCDNNLQPKITSFVSYKKPKSDIKSSASKSKEKEDNYEKG